VHHIASRIPGNHNVIADAASQKFRDAAEWMLDPKVFFTLCNTFGMPEIDMFATRLNKQLERYVSWAPNSGSIAIDAMSTSWRNKYIYIFPPFSMY